jgi:hypothetical protein
MNDPGNRPIACTLQGGWYHERLAWIADLARDGLRAHSRQDLTLELRYASDVAVRVRDMVRKEQECCAFLAFELTETGEDVRLTITAPERARDVATELFDAFIARPLASDSTAPTPSGETILGS